MVVVAGMGKLRHGGIVLPERAFSGAVGAEPRAKGCKPSWTAAMELRGQIPSRGNVGYPQQVKPAPVSAMT